MTETIFCKICLNINVKMYELRAYALEDCYVSIVGNLICENNTLNSMLYACYECTYLIHKYHSFKEKCLRGLSLLQKVVGNIALVSCEDIAAINRDELKLCSNLEPVSCGLYYHYIEHEDYDIKKEPNLNNPSDIIDNNILSVCEVKVENDVTRGDTSNQEFGDDQIYARPLETTKIVLEKNQVENDMSKNEDALNGDNEVFVRSLKRRKIQKIKNAVACTSVAKTHKHSSKKQNIKEKSSQSLDNSTIPPLHDSVKKRIRLKKKFQASDLKKGIKKQKSTYSNELTPEEKNMKSVLTVKILTLEEQMNNLLEKKKSSNYINSNYKCNLCYKGFMDSNTYNRHMAKHDPANGPFKCPVCKTVFQKERLVRHHSKLHNRNYICNICSHTCNNWPQAKQHQNEHIGKVYSCKHCEYITSKRSSHLSHVKLKHATGFVCNLCGFTFVSELGLGQHTTMMHGIKVTPKVQELGNDKQELKTTEERPNSKPGRYCDVCNVSFNSLQKWKRHVASSKHIYRLNGGTCGECEETFTSRKDLRLHYRQIHLKLETQHDDSTTRQGNPFLPKTWPAKCLHCSEELSDARQYYWHFRKAHPNEEYPVQKDYICDICGKLFGLNSTLVQHRRKHLNDGLYDCTQCSKAFVDKVQLVHHQKIHGDDRPFSCGVCCKAFKFEGALKKHLKCHS